MTKYLKRLATFVRQRKASAAAVVALCLVLVIIPVVHADTIQQQIDNVNAQSTQAQQSLSGLQVQASNYQDSINQLQTQINTIQQQISANEAQQAQIQAQITADQAQIAQQKQLLSQDIETMYVNGQMTTVEMLATSKNLSAFVDAETYRGAVQNKLQSLLTQIATLQNQLEGQKTQLEQSLQTQQAQNAQLASDQAQQNQLLSMNQAQQASYNQKIQADNAQLAQLQQEEIAANESGNEQTLLNGGPCGGSASYEGVTYTDTYPSGLCSIPQDSATDPWGLLNRECVSYTAWMESSTGHYVPYGLGNATNWLTNVPSSWVSSTPQAGDVAIRPAVPGLSVDGDSDVGHAMYVEKVINSDTILVSEYNENFNGDWSLQVRSTDALYNGYHDNLQFIQFPSN